MDIMISSHKTKRQRKTKLKYYGSIDFLPIRNYFEASMSMDYRWLLKLEDYSELPDVDIDLDKVWDRINGQYNDIVGGEDQSFIIEENRELLEDQQNILNYQNMISYLYLEDKQEYIDDLKKIKIEISTDPKKYYESLNKAEEVLIGMQEAINIKRSELSQVMPDAPKNVDYMEMVADVSVMLNRYVDIDKESIRFFANCLKSLKNKRNARINKKT